MSTKKTYALFAAGLVTTMLATACTRQDDTTAATDTTPAYTEPVATPDTSTPATTATSPTTTADATTTDPIEPATTPMPPAATTASSTMAFDDLDTNNDGSISRDELSETDSLRQNFSAADTDSNGSLSQAELDAHRATIRTPGG